MSPSDTALLEAVTARLARRLNTVSFVEGGGGFLLEVNNKATGKRVKFMHFRLANRDKAVARYVRWCKEARVAVDRNRL